MVTLISPIGDTDPIRSFRDGALLHIARKYHPERIILIYSERMVAKKDGLVCAIQSINDYSPEIIHHDEIISDKEVYSFDKMYEKMSEIVDLYQRKYANEDMLLNLSSGSPQMKAGLFVVNRLKDINVQAIQVSTPNNGSNAGIGHENIDDIEELIQLNEDARVNYIDRTVEDKSEKFSVDLRKRTARNLVEYYDFDGALRVVEQMSDFEGRKQCLNSLKELSAMLKRLYIPQVLQKKKLSDSAKKVLNAYLNIEIQLKQGDISNAFIKIKSLAEFIMRDYIESRYPKALENYLTADKKFLTSYDYNDILYDHGEVRFAEGVKPVWDLVDTRNLIAHTLDEPASDDIKKIQPVMKELKKIMNEYYQIPNQLYRIYEDVKLSILGDLR